MKQQKYDIFISYVHDDSRMYARILQMMLKNRGYKVFLDMVCLTDQTNFIAELKEALYNSKVYVVILSKEIFYSKYTVRGILDATELNKPIIPLLCNGQRINDEIDSVVPGAKDAYEILKRIQYSEIDFGVTLKSCLDFIEKTTIRQYVKPNLFRHLIYKIIGNQFRLHIR